ncbi:MAG TPA: hypothetical protein VK966_13765, partial [Longimicrobiales bacterium]|nr:hypothetical protein [Longimicrobiales bacterium]
MAAQPGDRPVFERPVFRPGLVPGVVDPDQVFLLTETRQYILMGRAYHAVAPLLDGTRSMGHVVEEAASKVPLPEAIYAMEQLIRKGYVVDAASSPTDEARAAWWTALGAAATTAQERLGQRR